MVVCKYFLQGNCKFGNRCHYEHTYDSSSSAYKSVLRPQIINNHNVPGQNDNQMDRAEVKAVINDMLAVEKGGQWLLSCYAPFKDKPNLQGFEDQSFEEVRFGYYEANKSSNLPQYLQNLQWLLKGVQDKMKALQHPSHEVVEIIKNLYSGQSGANQGVQNVQPVQNVFSNFKVAAPSSNNSIFSTQQTTFATNQTNTNNSIFSGVQNQQNTPQNIFAAQNVQNPNQNQFTSPLFTNLQTQNQIHLFNNPQVANQNSFTQRSFVNSASSSIFGGGFSQEPAAINEQFYSKLEDLTENDIKRFESERFENGKIPTKPPTYKMCF